MALIGGLASFFREKSRVFLPVYADDIVIVHRSMSALQLVLDKGVCWPSAKELYVNIEKTKTIRFFMRGEGTMLAEIGYDEMARSLNV